MVNGVVYTTAGTRRAVVALDAATGELLWVHGEHEGARGAAAPRQLSGRGVAYWTDGKEERILYVTPGYRLIALDAKTGVPVPGFGTNGVVDLKLDDDQDIQPDLITGEVGLQSAPVVAGNIVIVGAAFREGMTPKTMANNKGYVRGFDVRTGKRLWIFHTIPGRANSATTPGERFRRIHRQHRRLDPDHRRRTTRPRLSPGGSRPPATTTAAIAPATICSARAWSASISRPASASGIIQLVHHRLWDMDISSAPILVDITVDGKPIKAVAQPTKQGFLYVFDRVTGKPVWPIEEKPVEKGNVPGEWYSPTQPIPTKPPAYIAQRRSARRSDRFHARAARSGADNSSRNTRSGPSSRRPSSASADGPLATLTTGHRERRHQLARRLVRSRNPHRLRLRLQRLRHAHRRWSARQKDISDMNYVDGHRRPGSAHAHAGPVKMPAPIRRCARPRRSACRTAAARRRRWRRHLPSRACR